MSEERETALVTGATSGIGKAIAAEIARRGYDLLLTGRDAGELERICTEFSNRFPIYAAAFPADLSKADERIALCDKAIEQRVSILVNNAGFGVKGDFADSDLGAETDLIAVQINALIELTKAVIPSMKERGQRRQCHILNVSSVYALVPVPQQAVYAASKSFIHSFSMSLRDELADSGINVSVLAPGITKTAFRTRAGIPDKKGSGLSAEEVARVGIEQMLKRKYLIVPGASNKIFVFLSRHLPEPLSVRLINLINSSRGVRR